MNIQRAYTVAEIDALSDVVRKLLTYGSTQPRDGIWSNPSVEAVQQHVRTYMLGGITAADIYAQSQYTAGSDA